MQQAHRVEPLPRRPAALPAWRGWSACLALAALLGGCASGPRGGGAAAPGDRDGPEPNPPANLERVPDAEPKVEPIRSGGPNKPYEVFGRSYVPITVDAPFTERGLASWYGRKFHGKRTSSGELYNMYAMTAAHPTLPIPSYARVRNPANGREVVVRVNDRGPFHSNRVMDLSYTAALKLDLLRGVAPVEIERITFEDIRTGAWQRKGGGSPAEPAATVLAGAPPAGEIAPVVATAAEAAAPPPAASAPPAAPLPGEAAAATAANVAPLPPADAPVPASATVSAPGFWIQLGAFRQREGAEGFQRRVAAQVDWLSPLLAVFRDTSLFRLQAGPYPTREDARSAAERIRVALQLVPVVVERR